jgi:hypothetical protein
LPPGVSGVSGVSGVPDVAPVEPAAPSDVGRLLEKQPAARLGAWAAAQAALPVSESPAWTHLERELRAASAVGQMPEELLDAVAAEPLARQHPVAQPDARTAQASVIHPSPGHPARSAVAEMLDAAAEPAALRLARAAEQQDEVVPAAPSPELALHASGSRASARFRNSSRPASALPA